MFLKRIGTFFLDILEVIVSAIAIFLFVYLLILQPHKIKGASMEPNFSDSEYLLTDKLTYRFREPKRGEVIIFEAPGANGEEFIKRIIGLPGERVSINDGYYYIDGKKLDESYIPKTVLTYPNIFLKSGQEITVPPNSYFVSGDNRTASSDSRMWGFITKDKITGKAWFIYWPLKNMGLITAFKKTPQFIAGMSLTQRVSYSERIER